MNFNNGNGALSFSGNNAVIQNATAASITGFDGGLTVGGIGASIDNDGSITGAREFGVLFGSGSRDVNLDNSGKIYGGSFGVWVINSSDGGTTNNSGEIRSGSVGIGATLNTGVTTVINNAKDGVIQGVAKAIEVNFGRFVLDNKGTINGLVQGALASGADDVTNSGTINGLTRLGNGDDTFAFAGGKQGTVFGEADSDTFVFEGKIAPKKKGVATIGDFTPADDTIGLSKGLFKKIGKSGTLKDKFFGLGKKASDTSEHILYDDNSGLLRYDKDGKGGAKAKVFGLLDGGPDGVTADDFTIVA